LRGPFPLSMRGGERSPVTHTGLVFIANIFEDMYAFWTILLSILDNVIFYVPYNPICVISVCVCVGVCRNGSDAIAEWIPE
jgi:hypothetical protein